MNFIRSVVCKQRLLIQYNRLEKGNLCFDGAIWEIYGFRNPTLWNLKISFHCGKLYIFHALWVNCIFCAKIVPGSSDFPKLSFLFFFYFPPVPTIRLSLPSSLVKPTGTLSMSSPDTTHTFLRSAISPFFPFPSLLIFYVSSSTRLYV